MSEDSEQAKILDSANVFHDVDDLVSLGFQLFQIVTIDLYCQRAFDAAHRFFQVVGNRLGEVPDDSRILY